MMDCYVISRAAADDRWDAMRDNLARFGIEPVRWIATEPQDDAVAALWAGPAFPDVTRRIAIIRSYRALLEHLRDDSAGSRWLILQDDVLLDADPVRDSDRPIHLYDGYVRRGRPGRCGVPTVRVVDPLRSPHVCPRGFRVDRVMLEMLLDAWSDETQQTCVTWIDALRFARASSDPQPILVGGI